MTSPSSTLSIIKSKSFLNKLKSLNDGGSTSLFKTAVPQDSTMFSSTVLKDQQSLEKVRQKQINEMQSIVDYEFKLEEIREENERKIQQQKELEEKIRADKQQKVNEEAYKRKLKEQDLQRKEKEDYQKQLNQLNEKQRALENKDLGRKEQMEKKRKAIEEQSKLKSEINQKKLAITMRNLERKMQEQLEVKGFMEFDRSFKRSRSSWMNQRRGSKYRKRKKENCKD